MEFHSIPERVVESFKENFPNWSSEEGYALVFHAFSNYSFANGLTIFRSKYKLIDLQGDVERFFLSARIPKCDEIVWLHAYYDETDNSWGRWHNHTYIEGLFKSQFPEYCQGLSVMEIKGCLQKKEKLYEHENIQYFKYAFKNGATTGDFVLSCSGTDESMPYRLEKFDQVKVDYILNEIAMENLPAWQKKFLEIFPEHTSSIGTLTCCEELTRHCKLVNKISNIYSITSNGELHYYVVITDLSDPEGSKVEWKPFTKDIDIELEREFIKDSMKTLDAKKEELEKMKSDIEDLEEDLMKRTAKFFSGDTYFESLPRD